jgi:hypothetical protein
LHWRRKKIILTACESRIVAQSEHNTFQSHISSNNKSGRYGENARCHKLTIDFSVFLKTLFQIHNFLSIYVLISAKLQRWLILYNSNESLTLNLTPAGIRTLNLTPLEVVAMTNV